MDLLSTLRANTLEDHKTTEAESFMKDFFKAGLTTGSYAETLQKLSRVLIPIERSILAAADLPHFPSVKVRPTEEHLTHDLSRLGISMDIFPPGPKIATRPELLGVLYVIEGAANGGKILFHRLSQSAETDIASALRYFEYQSKAQDSRWAAFKNEISRQQFSPEEIESAVFSARKTFKSFL